MEPSQPTEPNLPPAQALGEFLKTSRKANRITLQNAATTAGITPAQLYHLESGTIPLPNEETLGKVAQAAGLGGDLNNPHLSELIAAARKAGPVDIKTLRTKENSLPAFHRIDPDKVDEFYEQVTTIPTWGDKLLP